MDAELYKNLNTYIREAHPNLNAHQLRIVYERVRKRNPSPEEFIDVLALHLCNYEVEMARMVRTYCPSKKTLLSVLAEHRIDVPTPPPLPVIENIRKQLGII